MKVILLILFLVNGVHDGPYKWLDKETMEQIEFANEDACDALVDALAGEWIAHTKFNRETDDVRLFWHCEPIGQDV